MCSQRLLGYSIVVCLWIEAIILIRENATRAAPEKPAQMQKQRRVHCIAWYNTTNRRPHLIYPGSGCPLQYDTYLLVNYYPNALYKMKEDWFLGSFGSLVPWFLGSSFLWFLGSLVPSFLRSFVPSFLGSNVPLFQCSFVPMFILFFNPLFLRSFVP